MKAPDKIYVAVYPNDNGEGQHLGDWFLEPEYRAEDNLEYIKKDMLLEWAKQKQYESTTIVADNFWQEVIDKISTL